MITVIGGTYREIDYDEIVIDIFGSGFRGSKFLLENGCTNTFSCKRVGPDADKGVDKRSWQKKAPKGRDNWLDKTR